MDELEAMNPAAAFCMAVDGKMKEGKVLGMMGGMVSSVAVCGGWLRIYCAAAEDGGKRLIWFVFGVVSGLDGDNAGDLTAGLLEPWRVYAVRPARLRVWEYPDEAAEDLPGLVAEVAGCDMATAVAVVADGRRQLDEQEMGGKGE